MKKKRQIEEIKQVLIKTCKRYRLFGEYYMQSKYAEALYNKGYRKQSDTTKKILQKLYNETEYFSIRYIIKELAEKYGVEVEE